MPRFTSRISAERRAAARLLYLGSAACAVALGAGSNPAAAQNASAGQNSPAAQSAPDALAAGREKFVQCASCHGADGRSTVMPQYPKIGGQTAEYVVIALKAYRDGRRLGTYAAIMAAVAKPLSDADIANLAAYVESLDASH
jgi:cytochrome c553